MLWQIWQIPTKKMRMNFTNSVDVSTMKPIKKSPVEKALAAGVYMQATDSFYWTRETIYQPAILLNQTPALLSEINCEPGMITCSYMALLKSNLFYTYSYMTLFKANFFYQLGQVYGRANAGWLQVSSQYYSSIKLLASCINNGQKILTFLFLNHWFGRRVIKEIKESCNWSLNLITGEAWLVLWATATIFFSHAR